MTQDEHRRVSVLLEKLADSDGVSAPDSVEASLVAALRRRRRQRLAVWPVLAAAAAVLVAVIAFRPAPETARPEPVVATIVPAAEPVVALDAQPVRVQAPRRVAPARRLRPEPGFIPLGVWQLVEPMERGTILRVRLPRSSMAEFGIPVNAERWNETVPADVMLAEDGSVRAVRFVPGPMR